MLGIFLLPNFNWIDILFTGKFYAIFSLLFGVGSAIFLRRAKEKGKPYRYYIRRMIGLALIGLLHAMIWGGDVLVPYALVGLVLLALHKIPARYCLSLPSHFMYWVLRSIFCPMIIYIVERRTCLSFWMFPLRLPC